MKIDFTLNTYIFTKMGKHKLNMQTTVQCLISSFQKNTLLRLRLLSFFLKFIKLACPFLKIEKKSPDFKKKYLTVSNSGLIVSFEMQF